MKTTPDALERRAAQQEAAALRDAAQAAKEKRARALLAEGLPLQQVALQLGMSRQSVARLRKRAA